MTKYPPMYFTLQAAMNSRYLDPDDVREHIIDKSEYRDENRKLWIRFIEEHPNDDIGKYVGARL
jgi:hypothetical protein